MLSSAQLLAENNVKTYSRIGSKKLPRNIKRIGYLKYLDPLSERIIAKYIGKNVPFKTSEEHNELSPMFYEEFGVLLELLYKARIRMNKLKLDLQVYDSTLFEGQRSDKIKTMWIDFFWVFIFKMIKHFWLKWEFKNYTAFDDDMIVVLISRLLKGQWKFDNYFSKKRKDQFYEWLVRWTDKIYLRRIHSPKSFTGKNGKGLFSLTVDKKYYKFYHPEKVSTWLNTVNCDRLLDVFQDFPKNECPWVASCVIGNIGYLRRLDNKPEVNFTNGRISLPDALVRKKINREIKLRNVSDVRELFPSSPPLSSDEESEFMMLIENEYMNRIEDKSSKDNVELYDDDIVMPQKGELKRQIADVESSVYSKIDNSSNEDDNTFYVEDDINTQQISNNNEMKDKIFRVNVMTLKEFIED